MMELSDCDKNYTSHDRDKKYDTAYVTKYSCNGINSYGMDKFTNNGAVHHFNKPPEAEMQSQTPMKDTAADNSWGEVTHKFCEDTSIHGFKQIAEEQPFLLRRLLWLILLLAGTAVFFVQMKDSIEYFNGHPVSVNIKINYNTTMMFPAITICNINAFRTTKAADMGWYELITELFSLSGANLTHYNATKMPLDEIYKQSAHSREDLVVSCEWGRDWCGPEDFLPRLTDYGLCYTFNSGHDGPIKYVSQTGTNGGLRLHLNIEQYEYMRGPNDGAGIRVLVHNPYDVPQVKDLGSAVMPGSHAYMGVQIIEVNNLEPPHGKCKMDMTSELHDVYTMANCADDCLTKKTTETCKCKDIFMKGDVPVCNLSSFQSCLEPTLDSFNLAENCGCTVPCYRKLHDPIMTYASTSNFDMDKMLKSGYIKDVEKLFVKARETVQRVDKQVTAQNKKLINSFHRSILTLDNRIDTIVEHLHTGYKSALKYVESDLKQRVSFHKRQGMDKVHYITKHDFDRGWEIIVERTIPYVTAAFFGTISTYGKVLEKMMNVGENCTELRQSTWLIAEVELSVKLQHALRAKDNITEANIAYSTGKTLLTYKASRDRRYDMSWVCLDILESSTHERQHEYYDNIMDSLKNYTEAIHELLDVGHQALENYTYDKEQYENASKAFVKAGKAYNYRLFLFEDRVIRPPLETSKSRAAEFDNQTRKLWSTFSEMFSLTSRVEELTKEVQTSWNMIRTIAEDNMAYLSNPTMQKTPLARRMNSKQMKAAMDTMIVFFGDIRARALNIHDQWLKIKDAIITIWKAMLADPCTKNFYKMVYDDILAMMNATTPDGREFYIRYFADLLDLTENQTRVISDEELMKMLNADFLTMDMEAKEAEIVTMVDEWLEQTAMDVILNDADEHFLKAFSDLQESFLEFLSENKVNSNFYKANFLRLDVFMRELSYEEILQEPAYGLTQLICDVGGSVGLFIGASFMSIFEIFDAIFHHMFKKLLVKAKKYDLQT